jgi:hypothetical protein
MLIDGSEDDVNRDKEKGDDPRDDKDLSKKPPKNSAPGTKDAIHNDLQGRSIEIGKKSAGITENQPRNVSFAAAVKPPTNSHSLCQGNLEIPEARRVQPPNPYSSGINNGTLHAQRTPQNHIRVDKVIQLKKNNFRQHIHRYTLRFKTIKPKSEDEGYQLIRDTLKRFLDIVLQAEPKTILPPYLELDRNDKSIQDHSSAFPVSSL